MFSIFHPNAASRIAVRSAVKRRRLALIAFSVSFLAVLLYALLLPSRYTSHLKLLVKNERANSLINVGGQTQGLVYLNDVSEARISTEIEILTSAELLRKVVDRCDLAATVPSSIKFQSARKEAAVIALQKALKVTSAHHSDVIEITYESPSPGQSQRVLDALTSLYLISHLQLHGAPGSYALFDSLWKAASTRLNESEIALDQFRTTAHVTSPAQERQILLQNIADLEKQVAFSTAGAIKNQQEAATYKDVLSQTPTMIERERRTVPNQQATQQLETMLVTLSNKRAEASTRYRPDDRIITELDTQIKLTHDALNETSSAPSQEVLTAQNPLHTTAESDLVHARAGFAGGTAEAASLRSQIRMDRERLEQLGSATPTYDDLTRRVAELTSLADGYRKSRDEAEANELLDKNQLSNVAVVESPTAEDMPSAPRRGMILSLGLLWSIVFGVAVAYISELRSPKLRTTRELSRIPGLPLLGEVEAHAWVPLLGRDFPEVFTSMQRSAFIGSAEG